MAELSRLMVVIGANTRDLAIKMASATKDVKKFAQQSSKNIKAFATQRSEDMKRLGMAAGAMGVAMNAGFLLAVKTSAEFEQAIVNAGTVTGKFGDDLQKAKVQMSDVAKTLGETTVFSAREAANAMYDLASKGFDVASMSVQELQPLLDLAAATQADLQTTTQVTTATIRAFGLETEDAGRVADVFTKTIGSSAATIYKLKDSMAYVAPIAKTAGVSLEEVSATLGRIYDLGFPASMAGTAVRRAMATLIAPTDAAKEVLESMGVTMEDLDLKSNGFVGVLDNLAKAGIQEAQVLDIFGQRAGPVIARLVQMDENGKAAYQSISALTETLEKSGGTARKVAEEQLATLNGQWRLLISAMEGVSINVGSILIPALTKITKSIAGVTQQISVWIKQNPELAKTITVVGVAVAGLLTSLGGLVLLLPTLKAGWGLFAAATGLAGKSLMGIVGVIGVVAAKIALIGATIYAGIKVIKAYGYAFRDQIESVKAFANAVGDFIKRINQYNPLVMAFGKSFGLIGKAINALTLGFKERVLEFFRLNKEWAESAKQAEQAENERAETMIQRNEQIKNSLASLAQSEHGLTEAQKAQMNQMDRYIDIVNEKIQTLQKEKAELSPKIYHQRMDALHKEYLTILKVSKTLRDNVSARHEELQAVKDLEAAKKRELDVARLSDSQRAKALSQIANVEQSLKDLNLQLEAGVIEEEEFAKQMDNMVKAMVTAGKTSEEIANTISMFWEETSGKEALSGIQESLDAARDRIAKMEQGVVMDKLDAEQKKRAQIKLTLTEQLKAIQGHRKVAQKELDIEKKKIEAAHQLRIKEIKAEYKFNEDKRNQMIEIEREIFEARSEYYNEMNQMAQDTFDQETSAVQEAAVRQLATLTDQKTAVRDLYQVRKASVQDAVDYEVLLYDELARSQAMVDDPEKKKAYNEVIRETMGLLTNEQGITDDTIAKLKEYGINTDKVKEAIREWNDEIRTSGLSLADYNMKVDNMIMALGNTDGASQEAVQSLVKLSAEITKTGKNTYTATTKMREFFKAAAGEAYAEDAKKVHDDIRNFENETVIQRLKNQEQYYEEMKEKAEDKKQWDDKLEENRKEQDQENSRIKLEQDLITHEQLRQNAVDTYEANVAVAMKENEAIVKAIQDRNKGNQEALQKELETNKNALNERLAAHKEAMDNQLKLLEKRREALITNHKEQMKGLKIEYNAQKDIIEIATKAAKENTLVSKAIKDAMKSSRDLTLVAIKEMDTLIEKAKMAQEQIAKAAAAASAVTKAAPAPAPSGEPKSGTKTESDKGEKTETETKTDTSTKTDTASDGSSSTTTNITTTTSTKSDVKGSAQHGLETVPETGNYTLHQGETVLPKQTAEAFRELAGRLTGKGSVSQMAKNMGDQVSKAAFFSGTATGLERIRSRPTPTITQAFPEVERDSLRRDPGRLPVRPRDSRNPLHDPSISPYGDADMKSRQSPMTGTIVIENKIDPGFIGEAIENNQENEEAVVNVIGRNTMRKGTMRKVFNMMRKDAQGGLR